MTINEVNNIVYGGYAIAPSSSVSLTEQYLSSLESGSSLTMTEAAQLSSLSQFYAQYQITDLDTSEYLLNLRDYDIQITAEDRDSFFIESLLEDGSSMISQAFGYSDKLNGYTAVHNYINPFDSQVAALLGGLYQAGIININDSIDDQIKDMYNYVINNFDYVCEEKDDWKFAGETIMQGYGDCEDLAILTASLGMGVMINNGISYAEANSRFSVVAGTDPVYGDHVRIEYTSDDGLSYIVDPANAREGRINSISDLSSVNDNFEIYFRFNDDTVFSPYEVKQDSFIQYLKTDDPAARALLDEVYSTGLLDGIDDYREAAAQIYHYMCRNFVLLDQEKYLIDTSYANAGKEGTQESLAMLLSNTVLSFCEDKGLSLDNVSMAEIEKNDVNATVVLIKDYTGSERVFDFSGVFSSGLADIQSVEFKAHDMQSAMQTLFGYDNFSRLSDLKKNGVQENTRYDLDHNFVQRTIKRFNPKSGVSAFSTYASVVPITNPFEMDEDTMAELGDGSIYKTHDIQTVLNNNSLINGTNLMGADTTTAAAKSGGVLVEGVSIDDVASGTALNLATKIKQDVGSLFQYSSYIDATSGATDFWSVDVSGFEAARKILLSRLRMANVLAMVKESQHESYNIVYKEMTGNDGYQSMGVAKLFQQEMQYIDKAVSTVKSDMQKYVDMRNTLRKTLIERANEWSIGKINTGIAHASLAASMIVLAASLFGASAGVAVGLALIATVILAPVGIAVLFATSVATKGVTAASSIVSATQQLAMQVTSTVSADLSKTLAVGEHDVGVDSLDSEVEDAWDINDNRGFFSGVLDFIQNLVSLFSGTGAPQDSVENAAAGIGDSIATQYDILYEAANTDFDQAGVLKKQYSESALLHQQEKRLTIAQSTTTVLMRISESQLNSRAIVHQEMTGNAARKSSGTASALLANEQAYIKSRFNDIKSKRSQLTSLKTAKSEAEFRWGIEVAKTIAMTVAYGVGVGLEVAAVLAGDTIPIGVGKLMGFATIPFTIQEMVGSQTTPMPGQLKAKDFYEEDQHVEKIYDSKTNELTSADDDSYDMYHILDEVVDKGFVYQSSGIKRADTDEEQVTSNYGTFGAMFIDGYASIYRKNVIRAKEKFMARANKIKAVVMLQRYENESRNIIHQEMTDTAPIQDMTDMALTAIDNELAYLNAALAAIVSREEARVSIMTRKKDSMLKYKKQLATSVMPFVTLEPIAEMAVIASSVSHGMYMKNDTFKDEMESISFKNPSYIPGLRSNTRGNFTFDGVNGDQSAGANIANFTLSDMVGVVEKPTIFGPDQYYFVKKETIQAITDQFLAMTTTIQCYASALGSWSASRATIHQEMTGKSSLRLSNISQNILSAQSKQFMEYATLITKMASDYAKLETKRSEGMKDLYKTLWRIGIAALAWGAALFIGIVLTPTNIAGAVTIAPIYAEKVAAAIYGVAKGLMDLLVAVYDGLWADHLKEEMKEKIKMQETVQALKDKNKSDYGDQEAEESADSTSSEGDDGSEETGSLFSQMMQGMAFKMQQEQLQKVKAALAETKKKSLEARNAVKGKISGVAGGYTSNAGAMIASLESTAAISTMDAMISSARNAEAQVKKAEASSKSAVSVAGSLMKSAVQMGVDIQEGNFRATEFATLDGDKPATEEDLKKFAESAGIELDGTETTEEIIKAVNKAKWKVMLGGKSPAQERAGEALAADLDSGASGQSALQQILETAKENLGMNEDQIAQELGYEDAKDMGTNITSISDLNDRISELSSGEGGDAFRQTLRESGIQGMLGQQNRAIADARSGSAFSDRGWGQMTSEMGVLGRHTRDSASRDALAADLDSGARGQASLQEMLETAKKNLGDKSDEDIAILLGYGSAQEMRQNITSISDLNDRVDMMSSDENNPGGAAAAAEFRENFTKSGARGLLNAQNRAINNEKRGALYHAAMFTMELLYALLIDSSGFKKERRGNKTGNARALNADFVQVDGHETTPVAEPEADPQTYNVQRSLQGEVGTRRVPVEAQIRTLSRSTRSVEGASTPERFNSGRNAGSLNVNYTDEQLQAIGQQLISGRSLNITSLSANVADGADNSQFNQAAGVASIVKGMLTSGQFTAGQIRNIPELRQFISDDLGDDQMLDGSAGQLTDIGNKVAAAVSDDVLMNGATFASNPGVKEAFDALSGLSAAWQADGRISTRGSEVNDYSSAVERGVQVSFEKPGQITTEYSYSYEATDGKTYSGAYTPDPVTGEATIMTMSVDGRELSPDEIAEIRQTAEFEAAKNALNSGDSEVIVSEASSSMIYTYRNGNEVQEFRTPGEAEQAREEAGYTYDVDGTPYSEEELEELGIDLDNIDFDANGAGVATVVAGEVSEAETSEAIDQAEEAEMEYQISSHGNITGSGVTSNDGSGEHSIDDELLAEALASGGPGKYMRLVNEDGETTGWQRLEGDTEGGLQQQAMEATGMTEDELYGVTQEVKDAYYSRKNDRGSKTAAMFNNMMDLMTEWVEREMKRVEKETELDEKLAMALSLARGGGNNIKIALELLHLVNDDLLSDEKQDNNEVAALWKRATDIALATAKAIDANAENPILDEAESEIANSIAQDAQNLEALYGTMDVDIKDEDVVPPADGNPGTVSFQYSLGGETFSMTVTGISAELAGLLEDDAAFREAFAKSIILQSQLRAPLYMQQAREQAIELTEDAQDAEEKTRDEEVEAAMIQPFAVLAVEDAVSFVLIQAEDIALNGTSNDTKTPQAELLQRSGAEISRSADGSEVAASNMGETSNQAGDAGKIMSHNFGGVHEATDMNRIILSLADQVAAGDRETIAVDAQVISEEGIKITVGRGSEEEQEYTVNRSRSNPDRVVMTNADGESIIMRRSDDGEVLYYKELPNGEQLRIQEGSRQYDSLIAGKLDGTVAGRIFDVRNTAEATSRIEMKAITPFAHIIDPGSNPEDIDSYVANLPVGIHMLQCGSTTVYVHKTVFETPFGNYPHTQYSDSLEGMSFQINHGGSGGVVPDTYEDNGEVLLARLKAQARAEIANPEAYVEYQTKYNVSDANEDQQQRLQEFADSSDRYEYDPRDNSFTVIGEPVSADEAADLMILITGVPNIDQGSLDGMSLQEKQQLMQDQGIVTLEPSDVSVLSSSGSDTIENIMTLAQLRTTDPMRELDEFAIRHQNMSYISENVGNIRNSDAFQSVYGVFGNLMKIDANGNPNFDIVENFENMDDFVDYLRNSGTLSSAKLGELYLLVKDEPFFKNNPDLAELRPEDPEFAEFIVQYQLANALNDPAFSDSHDAIAELLGKPVVPDTSLETIEESKSFLQQISGNEDYAEQLQDLKDRFGEQDPANWSDEQWQEFQDVMNGRMQELRAQEFLPPWYQEPSQGKMNVCDRYFTLQSSVQTRMDILAENSKDLMELFARISDEVSSRLFLEMFTTGNPDAGNLRSLAHLIQQSDSRRFKQIELTRQTLMDQSRDALEDAQAVLADSALADDSPEKLAARQTIEDIMDKANWLPESMQEGDLTLLQRDALHHAKFCDYLDGLQKYAQSVDEQIRNEGIFSVSYEMDTDMMLHSGATANARNYEQMARAQEQFDLFRTDMANAETMEERIEVLIEHNNLGATAASYLNQMMSYTELPGKPEGMPEPAFQGRDEQFYYVDYDNGGSYLSNQDNKDLLIIRNEAGEEVASFRKGPDGYLEPVSSDRSKGDVDLIAAREVLNSFSMLAWDQVCNGSQTESTSSVLMDHARLKLNSDLHTNLPGSSFETTREESYQQMAALHILQDNGYSVLIEGRDSYAQVTGQINGMYYDVTQYADGFYEVTIPGKGGNEVTLKLDNLDNLEALLREKVSEDVSEEDINDLVDAVRSSSEKIISGQDAARMIDVIVQNGFDPQAIAEADPSLAGLEIEANIQVSKEGSFNGIDYSITETHSGEYQIEVSYDGRTETILVDDLNHLDEKLSDVFQSFDDGILTEGSILDISGSILETVSQMSRYDASGIAENATFLNAASEHGWVSVDEFAEHLDGDLEMALSILEDQGLIVRSGDRLAMTASDLQIETALENLEIEKPEGSQGIMLKFILAAPDNPVSIEEFSSLIPGAITDQVLASLEDQGLIEITADGNIVKPEGVNANFENIEEVLESEIRKFAGEFELSNLGELSELAKDREQDMALAAYDTGRGLLDNLGVSIEKQDEYFDRWSAIYSDAKNREETGGLQDIRYLELSSMGVPMPAQYEQQETVDVTAETATSITANTADASDKTEYITHTSSEAEEPAGVEHNMELTPETISAKIDSTDINYEVDGGTANLHDDNTTVRQDTVIDPVEVSPIEVSPSVSQTGADAIIRVQELFNNIGIDRKFGGNEAFLRGLTEGELGDVKAAIQDLVEHIDESGAGLMFQNTVAAYEGIDSLEGLDKTDYQNEWATFGERRQQYVYAVAFFALAKENLEGAEPGATFRGIDLTTAETHFDALTTNLPGAEASQSEDIGWCLRDDVSQAYKAFQDAFEVDGQSKMQNENYYTCGTNQLGELERRADARGPLSSRSDRFTPRDDLARDSFGTSREKIVVPDGLEIYGAVSIVYKNEEVVVPIVDYAQTPDGEYEPVLWWPNNEGDGHGMRVSSQIVNIDDIDSWTEPEGGQTAGNFRSEVTLGGGQSITISRTNEGFGIIDTEDSLSPEQESQILSYLSSLPAGTAFSPEILENACNFSSAEISGMQIMYHMGEPYGVMVGGDFHSLDNQSEQLRELLSDVNSISNEAQIALARNLGVEISLNYQINGQQYNLSVIHGQGEEMLFEITAGEGVEGDTYLIAAAQIYINNQEGLIDASVIQSAFTQKQTNAAVGDQTYTLTEYADGSSRVVDGSGQEVEGIGSEEFGAFVESKQTRSVTVGPLSVVYNNEGEPISINGEDAAALTQEQQTLLATLYETIDGDASTTETIDGEFLQELAEKFNLELSQFIQDGGQVSFNFTVSNEGNSYVISKQSDSGITIEPSGTPEAAAAMRYIEQQIQSGRNDLQTIIGEAFDIKQTVASSVYLPPTEGGEGKQETQLTLRVFSDGSYEVIDAQGNKVEDIQVETDDDHHPTMQSAFEAAVNKAYPQPIIVTEGNVQVYYSGNDPIEPLEVRVGDGEPITRTPESENLFRALEVKDRAALDSLIKTKVIADIKEMIEDLGYVVDFDDQSRGIEQLTDSITFSYPSVDGQKDVAISFDEKGTPTAIVTLDGEQITLMSTPDGEGGYTFSSDNEAITKNDTVLIGRVFSQRSAEIRGVRTYTAGVTTIHEGDSDNIASFELQHFPDGTVKVLMDGIDLSETVSAEKYDQIMELLIGKEGTGGILGTNSAEDVPEQLTAMLEAQYPDIVHEQTQVMMTIGDTVVNVLFNNSGQPIKVDGEDIQPGDAGYEALLAVGEAALAGEIDDSLIADYADARGISDVASETFTIDSSVEGKPDVTITYDLDGNPISVDGLPIERGSEAYTQLAAIYGQLKSGNPDVDAVNRALDSVLNEFDQQVADHQATMEQMLKQVPEANIQEVADYIAENLGNPAVMKAAFNIGQDELLRDQFSAVLVLAFNEVYTGNEEITSLSDIADLIASNDELIEAIRTKGVDGISDTEAAELMTMLGTDGARIEWLMLAFSSPVVVEQLTAMEVEGAEVMAASITDSAHMGLFSMMDDDSAKADILRSHGEMIDAVLDEFPEATAGTVEEYAQRVLETIFNNSDDMATGIDLSKLNTEELAEFKDALIQAIMNRNEAEAKGYELPEISEDIAGIIDDLDIPDLYSNEAAVSLGEHNDYGATVISSDNMTAQEQQFQSSLQEVLSIIRQDSQDRIEARQALAEQTQLEEQELEERVEKRKEERRAEKNREAAQELLEQVLQQWQENAGVISNATDRAQAMTQGLDIYSRLLAVRIALETAGDEENENTRNIQLQLQEAIEELKETFAQLGGDFAEDEPRSDDFQDHLAVLDGFASGADLQEFTQAFNSYINTNFVGTQSAALKLVTTDLTEIFQANEENEHAVELATLPEEFQGADQIKELETIQALANWFNAESTEGAEDVDREAVLEALVEQLLDVETGAAGVEELISEQGFIPDSMQVTINAADGQIEITPKDAEEGTEPIIIPVTMEDGVLKLDIDSLEEMLTPEQRQEFGVTSMQEAVEHLKTSINETFVDSEIADLDIQLNEGETNIDAFRDMQQVIERINGGETGLIAQVISGEPIDIADAEEADPAIDLQTVEKAYVLAEVMNKSNAEQIMNQVIESGDVDLITDLLGQLDEANKDAFIEKIINSGNTELIEDVFKGLGSDEQVEFMQKMLDEKGIEKAIEFIKSIAETEPETERSQATELLMRIMTEQNSEEILTELSQDPKGISMIKEMVQLGGSKQDMVVDTISDLAGKNSVFAQAIFNSVESNLSTSTVINILFEASTDVQNIIQDRADKGDQDAIEFLLKKAMNGDPTAISVLDKVAEEMLAEWMVSDDEDPINAEGINSVLSSADSVDDLDSFENIVLGLEISQELKDSIKVLIEQQKTTMGIDDSFSGEVQQEEPPAVGEAAAEEAPVAEQQAVEE